MWDFSGQQLVCYRLQDDDTRNENLMKKIHTKKINSAKNFSIYDSQTNLRESINLVQLINSSALITQVRPAGTNIDLKKNV